MMRESRKYHLILLLLILALAGMLRCYDLTGVPPGLHEDEAANAWNAWSLLRTGQDQAGVRWPILYMRALGENRSALFLYYLIPFFAVGGFHILTLRLAAATAGVAAVALAYLVGVRLAGRRMGLLAAFFLAVSPWHVQQSRWGHEAILCALLALASLLVVLASGLVRSERRPDAKPRPWIALLAGMTIGISCYGYPALRLFLPVFFIGLAAVSVDRWLPVVKTRRGGAAAFAFILGGMATFGPLLAEHVLEPYTIGRRIENRWVWIDETTVWGKTGAVLGRYIHHFGSEFLFDEGDYEKYIAPPDMGEMNWYMLAFMIAGLAWAAWNFRASAGARIILVWVVTYPVSDILMLDHAMNALRSQPGLTGLVLLGAYGADGLWALLSRLRHPTWRRPAIAVGCVLGLFVLASDGFYIKKYFIDYRRDPKVILSFRHSLVEAFEFIRPRLEHVDALFVLPQRHQFSYIVSLVVLGYDPAQWHNEPKAYIPGQPWDNYLRYGKIYFPFGGRWQDLVTRYLEDVKLRRVLFLARGSRQLEYLRSRFDDLNVLAVFPVPNDDDLAVCACLVHH